MEYGAGSVPTAPEVAQDGNQDTIDSIRGVRGWPEGAAYRPPWIPTLFPAVLALAFAVIVFPAITVAQTATVTNSPGKITSPARNLASPQTRSPSGTSRQTGSIGSLDVETQNTVDGDLRASEGGVVSIGDVNTSGVSAGKVTVRTKTTLDGGEFSRGGSGEVGVVGLQDLSAGTVNIESRNELSGKMRSSNNSSVSVGGVNVGSEKKQGQFNANRNSIGSFTTVNRAGQAGSSGIPAGQVSSQNKGADDQVSTSSPLGSNRSMTKNEVQEDSELPNEQLQELEKKYELIAERWRTVDSVVELVDVLDQLYELYKSAQKVRGGVELLNSSEQLPAFNKAKSQLGNGLVDLGGALLKQGLHNMVEEFYESKGFARLPEPVLHSLVDTGVNLMTGNLKGQIWDQSVRIIREYALMRETMNDVVSQAVTSSKSLLELQRVVGDPLVPTVTSAIQSQMNSGGEMISDWQAWTVNDGRKLMIIANLSNIRSKQLAGVSTTELKRGVKDMIADFEATRVTSLGLTDRISGIRRDEYRDFANEFAKEIDIEGWSTL